MVREWVVFYTFVLKKSDKLFITSLEEVRTIESSYIDCLNAYAGSKLFMWNSNQFEKYIKKNRL